MCRVLVRKEDGLLWSSYFDSAKHYGYSDEKASEYADTMMSLVSEGFNV